MNPIPLPIFAAGDDDLIKLIFGAIFVVIWIVGALMSAQKKKTRQQGRTPGKSWDEIFRERSGEPKRPPAQQQQQQQQQPPPPPRPPRPVQVIRSAPQPQTTLSGPPSGPAVRKKLRRKLRQDSPVRAAP